MTLDARMTTQLNALLSLADLLALLGLPGKPWVPDPSWLQLSLPMPALSASAIATLSAVASLRAQVLAQFGIDLLIPGQATAFVRLAATLTARLDAMMSMNLSLGLGVWPRLAAILRATVALEDSIALGLFTPMPPAYGPASLWDLFTVQLRLVLPLLALSGKLGLDLRTDFAAQLSAMVGAIVRIQMPQMSLGAISMMASLNASLTAVAQLHATMGINPLQVGLPAIQAAVIARFTAAVRLAMTVSPGGFPSLLALLPQLKLAFNPSAFATPAMISSVMAINARAVASMNWNIPMAAQLPILSIGLPLTNLSARLDETLGLKAALKPCASGCDAQALLGKVLAA